MQTDVRVICGRHITEILFIAVLSTLLLAVWAQPATATTFIPASSKDTSMTPVKVAIGDVSSDGLDDVVTANFNGNNISVFLQETSGTLTDAINYTLYPTTKSPIPFPGVIWGTTHPTSLAIGDLSGDGANDVVVTDEWNWSVFYFEQTSSPTPPLDTTPDLWQPTDVFEPLGLSQPPGDDPDELFTNEELKHPNAAAYRFHFTNLNLNQAGDSLKFTTGLGWTTLELTPTVSAVDTLTPVLYTDRFDPEGKMNVDFKISTDMTTTTSTWNIDWYEVWYDYTETHPFSLPYGIAIGDANHNRPGNEFVTTNPFLKTFTRFAVDATGNIYKDWWPDEGLAINTESREIALGDLNYDFTDDVLMGDWNANRTAIWRQGSTGMYWLNTRIDVPTGANPYGVAIGDLNQDGRNDVAATSWSDDQLSFAFQNPLAYHEPAVNLSTGNQPMGMDVADVTADGRNDIVVANSMSNNIGVFTQSADGTFTTQATYDSGEYPMDVASGDIDGDGGVEIVSADSNDDQITVFQPSPAVSWVTPASGAYTRGTIHPLVSAPGGTGIAQVQFLLDSLPRYTDFAAPYTFDLDTTLETGGTHVLRAIASDGYGHTYTSDRSFKIDNTRPSISYISGTPNPFYPIKRDRYKDNFYMRFKLSEAAGITVRIYYNGRLVRTLTKNGAAGWHRMVWDGKRSNGRRAVGTYKYRIYATDLAGNSRYSTLRTVKIKYYVLVLVAPNRVVLVPH